MAPTTVRARRLGLALRQCREHAGLTLDDAAEHVALTKSTISRIERAQTIARPGIVQALLRLYGVSGADLDSLVDLARDARNHGWWRGYADSLPSSHLDYLALESEADTISVYEASVVHGLLQTPDYARHVMRADAVRALSDEAVERWVEARQRRKDRLTGPKAPTVTAILDESALRRPVGTPDVMKCQLEHLIKMSELPNLTLQVLPLSVGAHPGLPGPVQILEFEDPGDPVVVVLETVAGDMLVDRPSQLRHCTAIYAHLRSLALTPTESRQAVREIIKTTT